MSQDNKNQISIYANEDTFAFAQRAAAALAASDMVPKEYKGSVPNVLIAMEMANRVKMPTFMVMQNMNIIFGRPSWSSAYIIGAINNSKRFSLLKFRYFGEPNTVTWGCVAYAKDKEDNEMVEGPDVTIQMAIDEGWVTKNGSKWKNMPKLMLMYRAAAFFGRSYCPDILLGMQTTEEMLDIGEDGLLKKESEITVDQINEQINKRKGSTAGSESNAEDIPYEEVKNNGPVAQPEANAATTPPAEPLVHPDDLAAAKAAYGYYCQLHQEYFGHEATITPEKFVQLVSDGGSALKGNKVSVKARELGKPEYVLGDLPPEAGTYNEAAMEEKLEAVPTETPVDATGNPANENDDLS